MSYVAKISRREVTTNGKTFNSFRTITNKGDRIYVSFVKGCPEPQTNVLINILQGDFNDTTSKLYVTDYTILRNLTNEEIAQIEPNTLDGLFNAFDNEDYLETATV